MIIKYKMASDQSCNLVNNEAYDHMDEGTSSWT